MRSQFLIAAVLVSGAAPLRAQQVSVTPFVGAISPMNSLVLDSAGTAYFRLRSHTIFGLQIGKQLSPSLGIQLQGGFGSGSLEILTGGTPYELQSSLWFVDARAGLRLLGNEDAKLLGIVGAGWTQYDLGFFELANAQDEDAQFKGTITGIVGLGTSVRLTSRLSMVAELTDRIHEQGVDLPGISGLITPLQHDLMMTFGLNVPLGN